MVTTILAAWSPQLKGSLGQFKKNKDATVKAFIQARRTSKRLPDKIYADIAGVPMLYHVVDRVRQARLVDEAILCVPHELEDIPEGIKQFVSKADEGDVLSRFYHCLLENDADYILRITADCPLLDPCLIDFVVHHGVRAKADYCSNVFAPSFPDGVDCELISRNMLMFLQATMNSKYAREHVTIAIRENKKLRDRFNIVSVESKVDFSTAKWSVDTEADLERVRGIIG